jgi:glutaconate CoA-transferase subunit B
MPGAGPVKIITDMGILEANGESGEMELTALYPGVTPDDMRNAVGWPLRVRDTLTPVAAPTARELALLRDVLDPQRRYLRGGA